MQIPLPSAASGTHRSKATHRKCSQVHTAGTMCRDPETRAGPDAVDEAWSHAWRCKRKSFWGVIGVETKWVKRTRGPANSLHCSLTFAAQPPCFTHCEAPHSYAVQMLRPPTTPGHAIQWLCTIDFAVPDLASSCRLCSGTCRGLRKEGLSQLRTSGVQPSQAEAPLLLDDDRSQ